MSTKKERNSLKVKKKELTTVQNKQTAEKQKRVIRKKCAATHSFSAYSLFHLTQHTQILLKKTTTNELMK